MTRYLLLFMTFALCFSNVQAQKLYQPRNVKQAYEKDTRSPDGMPGENYWQNRAEYTINITASPPNRTIRGSEHITYYNNSPDSLETLMIDLFLNNHKPTAPRGNGTSREYLTSGVHIDSLAINGQTQKWKDNPRSVTFDPLQLPQPLAPGESVELSIDWHYKVSKQAGREGQIDSTSYFLAYFYPRVAVYDDHNGWDTIEFTGRQEFYNDFNDYTVNITVPKGYLVWGTGTLQNPGEVLQPKAEGRFQKSLTVDSTLTVASLDQLKADKVTTQNGTNTWTFTSSNIPDVAFGLSNHFVWDAASVVADSGSNQRVSVQAAYNDTSADYRHMVGYGRHAVKWFSNNWPGVTYPYPKSTVFQGGAGMEYPMMANDASYPDTVFARFVAEHEIAHTYFPFYMGTNESRYAFMDEGWATALELLVGRQDLGKTRANQMFRRFRVARWINNPDPTNDLPIITPADMLTGAAYGNNAYGKAALGYLALKDMLGNELFKKCLHTYMDRWHGKHPTPWDFFYSFNDVSGRNLNWFWNSWFFENSYIDLAIAGAESSQNRYSVTLKNIGGMPAPVDMKVTYGDGSTEVLHQSPGIWKGNQNQATVDIQSEKAIKSIELSGGIWMDADLSNNKWTSS